MPDEPHPFGDEIHIEQLEVATHIGVPEQERANPQRLSINISFWPRQHARDLADNIHKTVNYSDVAEATRTFMRAQSISLVETLADRLAAHLLKIFPIQELRVEIRKFPLPDAKYVSVTVTRAAAAGR